MELDVGNISVLLGLTWLIGKNHKTIQTCLIDHDFKKKLKEVNDCWWAPTCFVYHRPELSLWT
jgi:hypothetical protein